MIDFKPIEEFTFDDCIKSIERYRSKGLPIDADLQARYEVLLSSLKSEEKRDYSKATRNIGSLDKAKEALEQYIKKYSSLPGATQYKPQHLQEAKDQIIEWKKIRKRRRLLKRVWIIALSIVGICFIIFLGYRPVADFSINPEISFSAIRSSQKFKLSTSRANSWIFESPSEDWISLTENSDSITISVSQNNEKSRYGEITFYAYNYLFGFRLNSETKKIRVVQFSGNATFLDISKSNVYIDKWGSSGTNYTFTISTDGVEIFGPLLYPDSWIDYKKSVISESPLEIKYTLTAEKNPGAERVLELDFSSLDGSISKSISIVQQSGIATYFKRAGGDRELDVRKDALPEGKCYTVDVDTDGTYWYVSSCPQWIKYRIIGNRLELRPETWIKENSQGIQIGRFGEIILKSNNPELPPITIAVNQGLIGNSI